jgi:site-specific recombinase XerD
MTTTATITAPLTMDAALERFINALDARNRSQATVAAYQRDLSQLCTCLTENNAIITSIDQVERIDITEDLAALGKAGVTGITRARKLAAIRELFRPGCTGDGSAHCAWSVAHR